ncbi:murein biosynthesis integral membrane protein MurJ [Oscillatoriales cyanobacterium USR001]|nr:murein biosynthesis integral membrane protein MurJ [Oscillatoriales cyanobacterium USR001]
MSESLPKPKRSLAGIAGIVAVATLISKVFGLVRQQAIAAAFGVGAVIDAYNYAYVIPGFLFILLGGINGPFHSAIVSALAKHDKSQGASLVETITTLVGIILLFVTCALIIFADPMIDLVAPGLTRTSEGLEIRSIAIQQFRIMAPMALLSGLIGIGFGTLNAADMYWLPSISPLFSSVAVIGGLAIFALQFGDKITQPKYALLGGLVLAWGTLAGAAMQWFIQVVAQWRSGLGSLRWRFDLKQPGIRDVMKVMLPATLSSGMLQINVYTDLFFASYIPQAAAAMGYAGLLVMTPLGIISNVILVPFLPIFSRLAQPNNWPELKQRIRQSLILTALTMLPLSALMVTLALPIVRVVYERVAFKASASEFVAPVLMAYGIGMFVYLGRDVVVRIFYALGDGETPFRISIINIFLNGLLDFLLVKPFGAVGLVLATVGVNLISMVMLLWLLDRKLNGLPWRNWTLPFFGLTAGSSLTGFVALATLKGCQIVLGTEGLLIQLVQLTVASLAGLVVFVVFIIHMNLPEFDLFVGRLRSRFKG